ncbi:MAG TPA: (4Fe-4S)-binding protein [Clostridiales bacterium]|nr:(4Fe-4S)-binding protein [Clostridiales bacterium]
MRIAVLSGKGGTGKTTVAACLSASADRCQYVDCDVEEPNGAIFLKPQLAYRKPVYVMIPEVVSGNCTGCGTCVKACRFHAMACINKKILIFPELCHHCGACGIACRNDAIVETQREVGVIESDQENLFLQGTLHTGEPVTVPVIHALKDRIRTDIPVILDCAPGASCTVVQTIDGCDYCILVTEPTPFGLYDLNIAYQLTRKMHIPSGVVLNKAMEYDPGIKDYCDSNHLQLLMEIPYSRQIAEEYSRGVLPVETDIRWKDRFSELFGKISGGGAK